MRQPSTKPVLLVIEDDSTTADLISQLAIHAGYDAVVCPDAASARSANWSGVSAVLLDLGLPDGDGLDLLSQTRKKWPELPFFILTARDSAEIAVAALKSGAVDYLTKPFDPTRLLSVLEGAMGETTRPVRRADVGPGEWKSPAMRRVHEQAANCAGHAGPVILLGEPGTGKRTLAQWIHSRSARSGRQFATLDAASLDDQSADIELFGGELLRPTGRASMVRGKIEIANGGSLFIQDIDRLSIRLQSRLVDSLEGHLAAGHVGKSEFRLIASARQDLREGVERGTFRSDLYYRLSANVIHLPSVREASQDIPVWCDRLLTEICLVRRCRLPVFSRGAREAMAEYSWPGNLDELRREIEKAVEACEGGIIGEADLGGLITSGERGPEELPGVGLPGSSTIRALERRSLLAALDACGGNRRRAAKRLGVSLRTIYNMIARHGLATRSAGGLAIEASAGREDRDDNGAVPQADHGIVE